jgi:hypothetical protein
MALSYDLSMGQGSDFSLSLNLTGSNGAPINLSGYNISGYIKNYFSDTGFLLNISPSIVNAASGLINIYIPAAQTINLPINMGRYSIGISNGFSTSNVLYGKVFTYPSVFATEGLPFTPISITGQDFYFSTSLLSGVNTQFITYPNILQNAPASVDCDIENNIDNYSYIFNLSNITNSGFQINFSDYLKNTGYILLVSLGT